MEVKSTLFLFSLLLLFSPLAIGGAVGFWATWMGLKRRTLLMAWPRVRAVVLGSEVKHSEYRGLMGSREQAWDLLVDFEYEAGGKTLQSQVSLEVDMPRSAGRADPEGLDDAVAAAKAKIESGFQVHVDPDDHAQVMLPVEPSGWIYFRLVMFGAALAVSLLVLGFVFTS